MSSTLQAKDAVQPYCSKVASAASDAGTYASKQTHLLTEKVCLHSHHTGWLNWILYRKWEYYAV